MKTAITIRLKDDLVGMLNRVCLRTGKNRSEVIRNALKRQLSILMFEQLRQETMPFAEARGYLTDEDVFRDIS